MLLTFFSYSSTDLLLHSLVFLMLINIILKTHYFKGGITINTFFISFLVKVLFILPPIVFVKITSYEPFVSSSMVLMWKTLTGCILLLQSVEHLIMSCLIKQREAIIKIMKIAAKILQPVSFTHNKYHLIRQTNDLF